MKKILALVNVDTTVYNVRKEIMSAFLNHGYEVYISAPIGERTNDLIDMGFICCDIKFDRHNTNPFKDIKLLCNYLNLFKKVQPDIVLTYTIKPNIYGSLAARILGIPTVTNITGLGTAVEFPGLLQKITVLLYRISLKRTCCVYFQNIENENFFQYHRIAIGKHELLPGSGVNLEEFQLMDYPPDIELHFLFIARIVKEKGIDEYLEAAQYIRDKYPFTRFHVIGSCEDAYEPLLEEKQEKGIIIYHGGQKDIRPYLKICHCTVHPSYYPEGMSNVCLESAACGRPVITTDRSGCRETIEDKITGLLIRTKDTIQLIDAIETFIQMPYEKQREMGLAGRKRMEKMFDRNIIIHAYLNKAENILGQGKYEKS